MNFLRSAQLALTPLSPIHIGCGDDFEPTNYVIENGLLYGFDASRAVLPENLRQRLSQLGDKADLLGIQRFFREHRQHFIPHADVLMPVAKGLAADYEKQVGQVANNEGNGNRVFNQLFIERASHSGGQPLIPGSSVKGALRTAVVDAINNGQRVIDRDEIRKPDYLEKRLLEGDFATSPLRLLKTADFMPVSEVARQVLYGQPEERPRSG
jgi:CRISPR-associated protein Csm5